MIGIHETGKKSSFKILSLITTLRLSLYKKTTRTGTPENSLKDFLYFLVFWGEPAARGAKVFLVDLPFYLDRMLLSNQFYIRALPPKTNISPPEKEWLEDEISFEMVVFFGYMLIFRGVDLYVRFLLFALLK